MDGEAKALQLKRLNRRLRARVARRAEELSRRTNLMEFFREVLEHLPVGLIGVDDEGTIALANRWAQDVLCNGVSAVLGMPWEAVLPEATIAEVVEGAQAAREGRVRRCLFGGRAWDISWSRVPGGEAGRGYLLIFHPAEDWADG
jgi:PAS domain-containing protein